MIKEDDLMIMIIFYNILVIFYMILKMLLESNHFLLMIFYSVFQILNLNVIDCEYFKDFDKYFNF